MAKEEERAQTEEPCEPAETLAVSMHHDPWAREGGRIVVGPSLPSQRAQAKKRHPPPQGWTTWWPVAIGLVLAIIAPDLRKLALLWEPWGMRLLFPYSLLPGQHELGLSDELTRILPQLMLFLQFPLEGFLTKLTLSSGVKLMGAMRQILFLHLVGAIVLFLISGTTPP